MNRMNSSRLGLLAIIVFPFIMAIGCSSAGTPQISLENVKTLPPRQEISRQIPSPSPWPMGQVSASSYKDYSVGPEDLLEINFYGQKDLDREVRVNGNGEIALPLVGPVKVVGLSPMQIESLLMNLYKEKRMIKNPQISVFVKEYRSQRVMITGAVKNPGPYDVIGNRTLLEMLGKAGGIDERAGNMVQIVRHQSHPLLTKEGKNENPASQPGAPEITFVDMRQMMTKGAMNLNVPIRNGDIIYVPYANNAYVLGAVNRPGNVLIKDNLTVTQAVAMAGGLNPSLASGQIYIIRFDDKGHRIKIPVNLDRTTIGEAKDVILKDNDVVYAQESGFKKFLYNFRVLNPIPVGAAIPY